MAELSARVGRQACLAALVLVAAFSLAACGGSSNAPQVVSLRGSSGRASTGGARTVDSSQAKGNNPTALVDAWASCMRSHGVPDQADPVIDSHGVINIIAPPPGPGGLRPSADAHNSAGACGRYLVKAQTELRAEDPVQDPQGVPTSTAVPFSNCMRANGVPNYPYPSGPDDSSTNFNGTGVNPNSPHVMKVNDYCGKKLGLPTWWINGWGPPGDLVVKPAVTPHIPGCDPPWRKGCNGGLVFVPNGNGRGAGG